MRRADFHYELPDELIARYPAAQRSASRLLVVDAAGECHDRLFRALPGELRPGDLLVFNRSRVIPARLFGRKATGGRVELLIERVTGETEALAYLRASKTPRPGARIDLDGGATASLLDRDEALWRIRFSVPVSGYLDRHGHVPLPPYIDRPDEPADRERYQTVYADRPGAVAAPTAGLHFDEPLLGQLRDAGIETAFLTLHVGAGTFAPVRSDDIDAHRMHAERLIVDAAVCDAVARARERGGRVVAVGTTSVRALESAADSDGAPEPVQTDTRLFIRPGFEFRVVDALITNFHLPESTLMMLVSAFAGHRTIMRAYRHAVRQRYRFFSYGDAMLLHRKGKDLPER